MFPSQPIKIKKEIRPPVIDKLIASLFKQAMDNAILEMAVFLERESPRGISPASSSLKGGWQVIATRKIRNFPRYEAFIVNTSSNAAYRIMGRGPGRFPPFYPGSPLEMWATAHGIPAFLVARKIAREGTERWKEHRGAVPPLAPTTKLGGDAERVFQRTLVHELAIRGFV